MENQPNIYEKKKGKQKFSSSTPVHPEIPKGKRTKMQATKGPTIKIIALESTFKSSRVPDANAPAYFPVDDVQIRNSAALCLKVNHLITEQYFKVYTKHFLKNSIKVKYYVDKFAETEIDIDFLKPFENHIF